MIYKPIIIVLGEPYSVFSELFFKFLKSSKKKFLKNPIIVVGCEKLLKKQMKKLKYQFKFYKVEKTKLNYIGLNNKKINIVDIEFNFDKTFDKISSRSNTYILKCFKNALFILKNYGGYLINGPVSKKYFLLKKYLGITEFLSSSLKKKDPVMLIYNPSFSVSPITTHLPINKISRAISKKKIIHKILKINDFYKKYLRKSPRIALLGLNPHCETIDKIVEEEKYIIPALVYLKKRKIRINGIFSADTFFSKKNLKNFDVAVGMYHDQVLTPMKTIYEFNAINITIGLPFVRISPDHGPNNLMLGKNVSNAESFFASIDFIKKINAV